MDTEQLVSIALGVIVSQLAIAALYASLGIRSQKELTALISSLFSSE